MNYSYADTKRYYENNNTRDLKAALWHFDNKSIPLNYLTSLCADVLGGDLAYNKDAFKEITRFAFRYKLADKERTNLIHSILTMLYRFNDKDELAKAIHRVRDMHNGQLESVVINIMGGHSFKVNMDLLDEILLELNYQVDFDHVYQMAMQDVLTIIREKKAKTYKSIKYMLQKTMNI